MLARGPPAKTHLVVLVHGINGDQGDVEYFATAVSKCDPTVQTLAAASNGHWFGTLDGIDAGAARVAKEVTSVADSCPALQCVSFVGHSLGGVYCRYVVALLHRGGLFNRLQPNHLLLVASPSLGSLHLSRLLGSTLCAAVARGSRSKTMQQMLMLDSDHQLQGNLLQQQSGGAQSSSLGLCSRLLWRSGCREDAAGQWATLAAFTEDSWDTNSWFKKRGGQQQRRAAAAAAAAVLDSCPC